MNEIARKKSLMLVGTISIETSGMVGWRVLRDIDQADAKKCVKDSKKASNERLGDEMELKSYSRFWRNKVVLKIQFLGSTFTINVFFVHTHSEACDHYLSSLSALSSWYSLTMQLQVIEVQYAQKLQYQHWLQDVILEKALYHPDIS